MKCREKVVFNTVMVLWVVSPLALRYEPESVFIHILWVYVSVVYVLNALIRILIILNKKKNG